MKAIDPLMILFPQTELKCVRQTDRQPTTEYCFLKGFILKWVGLLLLLLPITVHFLDISSTLYLLLSQHPSSSTLALLWINLFIQHTRPSQKRGLAFTLLLGDMNFWGFHFWNILKQTKFFSSGLRKIIRHKYETVEIKQGNNWQLFDINSQCPQKQKVSVSVFKWMKAMVPDMHLNCLK